MEKGDLLVKKVVKAKETKVKKSEIKETGCCPIFDPKPYDKKEIKFKNKLFVKDRVVSFFHIPLNFGSVVVRNMKKISATKAELKNPIMLSNENSVFGTDIFIEVKKNVKGAKMVKMSGTFLTKVYEGSYKNMGAWIKDMYDFAKSKKKKVKKLYFYYTTCPKCAKAYGKNYVVIFAEI